MVGIGAKSADGTGVGIIKGTGVGSGVLEDLVSENNRLNSSVLTDSSSSESKPESVIKANAAIDSDEEAEDIRRRFLLPKKRKEK